MKSWASKTVKVDGFNKQSEFVTIVDDDEHTIIISGAIGSPTKKFVEEMQK